MAASENRLEHIPTKSFVVISEIDKTSKVLCMVVPVSWVLLQEKKFWYPLTNNETLETIVRGKTPPKTKPYRWRKYELHAIYFETSSYNRAISKLGVLEKEESDLSDAGFMGSSTPSVAVPTIPSALSSTCTNTPELSNEEHRPRHLLEKNKNQGTPSSIESMLEKPYSGIPSITSSERIFRELKYVRKGIDEIKEYLKKNGVVQVSQTNHTNSPQKTFVKFTPWRKELGLPISSTNEMDEFEGKLSDPAYFAKLVKLFEYSSNSGLTMKKKLELIMDQIFNAKIAKYYNCTGQYGKLNFANTRIYQELKGFMMNKLDTNDPVEIRKLEKCFVAWLKKKIDNLRLDERRNALYLSAVPNNPRRTSRRLSFKSSTEPNDADLTPSSMQHVETPLLQPNDFDLEPPLLPCHDLQIRSEEDGEEATAVRIATTLTMI